MNGIKRINKHVKMFEDKDHEEIIELSVVFDGQDPEAWIIISCDSDDISLSLKNWEILQDLVNQVLSRTD